MKKSNFILLALALLPVVSALVFIQVRSSMIRARANTAGNPFTVLVHEHHIATDGSRRETIDQTFATYSDGTVVDDMIDRLRNTRIADIKHPIGLEIRIRPVEGLKSTVKRNAESLLRQNGSRLDPAADCMANLAGEQWRGYTKIGIETIQGIRAVHAVFTVDGQRHVWLAPDFGCYVVQQRWRFQMPDGKFSETNKDLISAVRGEPDPGLRNVEPALTEVPLSEINFIKRKPESDQDKRTAESMDRFYHANRP